MLKFTIIIPTYNREKQIISLLNQINSLSEKSPPFEVIVVDDGSLYPLNVQKNEYNYQITLLRQENSGPAKARNAGAEMARGEFLVFIDDDCMPDVDWLIQYEESCDKNPTSLLGGHTVNGLEGNQYSHTTQMLVDFLLDCYSPREYLGGFFSTNNMLVSRAMFRALEGFNPILSFGEDREFCYRWAVKGLSFIHVKGAKISHFHSLNFISFLKLHFKYGTGTYHFRRLASENIQNPIPFSRPDFYLRLILSPFKRHEKQRAIVYTALLFGTQIANVSGVFAAWFAWSFNNPDINAKKHSRRTI